MIVKRKIVQADIERKILIGLITSDDFCKQAYRIARVDYFKSTYAKIIFRWVEDFYGRYKECPGHCLQDIYVAEKDNLKEADAEIVGHFLGSLSDEYEKSTNDAYLADQAKRYFRERSLVMLSESISGNVARGKLQKAEESIRNYGEVSQQMTSWFNPFDPANIVDVFDNDGSDRLFKLNGPLGEMTGYLERDWLVAFMAPMKRGKCASGDSKVLLANGEVILLRDLVKSGKKENIVAFNEQTQKFESTKIVELFDNGVKDCWEIKTRTGRSMITTETHKYLTPDGWKDLQDIKKGDFIGVPKKINFFGNESSNPNLIKFLSYMLAEGGCTGTQPVFTNNDDEINFDFEKCCDDLGIGYTTKEINHFLTKANPILRKYGIMGCSAKTKIIPDFIMKSCKKDVSLFLRIFFTCDGTIYNETNKKLLNVELTLANKQLIDQISHLLLRFGIVHLKSFNSATCNGEKFDAWRISIKGQEYVNLFLQCIGFDDPKTTNEFEVKTKRSFIDKFPWQVAKRFRNELKQECNGRPRSGDYPKGNGFYKQTNLSQMQSVSYSINKKRCVMRQSFESAKNTASYDKYMNSNILWDEVSSIEYFGKIDTYDIAVPNHHNFVADDCIIHNSWWLQELAICGLFAGLKVAYFSLEMNKKAVSKRIYKRITALTNSAGRHHYPVFDCYRNQTNTCKRIQRTCRCGIKEPGEDQPEFYYAKGYKPCTQCVGTEDYVQAVWYQEFNQSENMGSKNVGKKIKNFVLQYGDNLRIMAYPAFSASFDDMESDLDSLEFQEGFVPEMICTDYFDIANPGNDSGGLSERGRADHVWKRGKGLAAKRHCLMATVLQSNRASISKKSLEQEDTSEDIRKLAHVDLLLGLNQTKDEKGQGIMRVGVVAHRHEEFSFKGEVIALQSFAIGNPCLFSGWNTDD